MEQQQQQHQHQQMSVSLDSGGGGDRFPQWSMQETKEFLMIRGELDQTFMETKRNKLLWEVISTKMKGKGYNRSADQCKCKWKNLVTRYKGCESMEAEAVRQQFPFYNELQGILAARMQRIMWADVEGTSKKKGAGASSDEEEESESGRRKKKKKGNNKGSNDNKMREMLEEFMRQQMEMEGQWREAYEARERERRAKEMEWRQTMEDLEKERLLMERRWREREDQRRIREEARAHNRDALITALLNKLTNNDM